jgi:heparanase 1
VIFVFTSQGKRHGKHCRETLHRANANLKNTQQSRSTMHTQAFRLSIAAIGVAGLLASCASNTNTSNRSDGSVTVDAAVLPHTGTIDPRYQSYNVEMLEVTGGKFWKPYRDISAALATPAASTADVPAGMSADLYQYRPPIDLTNPRLRTLAKALGPAYVRVSGTWANTTYFTAAERPPSTPPSGYGGVLTRQQWQGVVDFSRAVDAPIVTSVPISAGTRDVNGLWQADQTRRWLAFTRSIGGTVAAAEFMNEPTLAAMGGAPTGYDAAAFGRDFKVFRDFMKKEAPQIKVLGPGSVGEAEGDWSVAMGGYGNMPALKAADLASAIGGDVDAFSYHHYGAASQRCAAMGAQHQTTAADALSEAWLQRTDATLAYYRRVRDRFMPGKHFWNTETADAACGGNPWGGQFLDTFRYLDQLGRLARQEVDVVMHNTLVASDYGLLDEQNFAPKPNYWGALLWRRLMGPVVLDSGVPVQNGRHVYAHCLRDRPGGVALLIINNATRDSSTLRLGNGGRNGQRYTLTSPQLQSRTVLLNGQPLALTAEDRLPALSGQAVGSDHVVVAPGSITFVTLPEAGNAAC